MIEQSIITFEAQHTPTATDWQRVLNLTVKPQRVFICPEDPILLVDALVEQLSPDKLKTLVDELVFRTKLFW